MISSGKYCSFEDFFCFWTFDKLNKHIMFQSKNGRKVKTVGTGYNPGLKGGWGRGISQGYERPGRRDRRK